MAKLKEDMTTAELIAHCEHEAALDVTPWDVLDQAVEKFPNLASVRDEVRAELKRRYRERHGGDQETPRPAKRKAAKASRPKRTTKKRRTGKR